MCDFWFPFCNRNLQGGGGGGGGGGQPLQPHESQLATFVEIPSSAPGGHCAHYTCPITVCICICPCVLRPAPSASASAASASASAASASTSNLLLLLLDLLDLLLDLQGQLMTDPVCDKDGHAYERTAILQRLANGRLLTHDG